eukprot:Hpha_TRINITY_DN19122_c0_g1::TRINITY_DN19122_c0_g1_i1::g.94706::m.94706
MALISPDGKGARRLIPTTTVIKNETEAEIKISIDNAKLTVVAEGKRNPIPGNWELKVVEVASENVAPASLKQIGAPEPTPPTLIFLSFDPGDDTTPQYHFLSRRTIVLKEHATGGGGGFLYTLVLAGRFLEFQLETAGLDEEDLEELEESIEVLDVLLQQSASLRIKGKAHRECRGVVKLTDQGELLQRGIGDEVAAVIGRSAHFLAKRVGEYHLKVCAMIEALGSKVLRFLPGANAGTNLRLQQSSIDDARRAALVMDNACRQGKNGVSQLLKEVTKSVGTSMGEEFLESDFGQNTLLKDRAVQEARKVVLAAVNAYEELKECVLNLPKPFLKAIFNATEVIVNHVWGPRARDHCHHCFRMLTDMLVLKYEMQTATPASLAWYGIRCAIRALCEPPSEKSVERTEKRRIKEDMVDCDRTLLLKKIAAQRAA